jgi:hypothetical protein
MSTSGVSTVGPAAQMTLVNVIRTVGPVSSTAVSVGNEGAASPGCVVAVSTGVDAEECDSEIEEITDYESVGSSGPEEEAVDPKDIDWVTPATGVLNDNLQDAAMDMVVSGAAGGQYIDPEGLIGSTETRLGPSGSLRGLVAHIFLSPIPFRATELLVSAIECRGALSIFGAAVLTMLTAEVNREMFLDMVIHGQNQSEFKGWVAGDVAARYEQCSGYVPPNQKHGGKSTGRLQFVLLVRHLARVAVSLGASGLDTVEGVQQCCDASEITIEGLKIAVAEVLAESARKMLFFVMDGWGQGHAGTYVQVARSRLYRFL